MFVTRYKQNIKTLNFKYINELFLRLHVFSIKKHVSGCETNILLNLADKAETN